MDDNGHREHGRHKADHYKSVHAQNVRGLRLVELLSSPHEFYISSIFPIGTIHAFSLWFSNSAYIYSVSFIQMLKALTPVAVHSMSTLLSKEAFRRVTMANMLSISIRVAIAAYGEARFDAWGVLLQLGAVATLYYVAPCCLVYQSDVWASH
ncbi:putative sugar phosphate/phosphate translocator [Platanthera guangdongensis]|uniref:Sugar phosphate/phosphate translocator n=1 Tax=Platanthera guangdongensis TaxID=2320717 RepID=A0ABR2LP99_9ASPA